MNDKEARGLEDMVKILTPAKPPQPEERPIQKSRPWVGDGSSINDRHGKMGVVERLRQATSIAHVYSLLESTKSMTLSAKTQKRVLKAAKGAIERLGGTLRVAVDEGREGGDATVAVAAVKDEKTNATTIVTLSPSPLHEEIMREPAQPTASTPLHPYMPEKTKVMEEADRKWKEGVFNDGRDRQGNPKKDPS